MNDSDQHGHESRGRRSRKTWAVALGTLIVASLAVASFGSFAGAADDTGGAAASTAPDGTARGHPQLTDEQKQCLAAAGVTFPQRPADGTRPTMPTAEQFAALKAAAEACGLPIRGPGGPGGPGFGHGPGLTDAQKQCLANAGLTFGPRPVDGTRPTPPTDEQRAAFKVAAAACGLPTPGARPTI